jgi:hypothetical protein
MNIIFRILIASGVAMVTMVATIMLTLLLFNVEAPKPALILGFAAWIVTFKMIKPSKKEIEKKKTHYKETFHENGVIKEKGMLKHGIREGEWDIFNEEGAYIRTDVYVNGQVNHTREA